LPFLNEHQYTLEDNKFIIREINKELPEILLRVSDYALHEFIFKNKVYKLYKLVKDETLLEISTEKTNYLYYYIGRLKDG
jgi:bacterioferritin (cytochrome b1)